MSILKNTAIPISLLFTGIFLFIACSAKNHETQNLTNNIEIMDTTGMQTATFGTGCFWCTEAIFESLKGVSKAVSGYSGGKTANPTYEQVCSGQTGHAECIQVTFDPSVISFQELLEAFWKSHDPTTLNRQGADVGTQYRSVIFYHTDEQRQFAQDYKKKLNDNKAFDNPVVTEIAPFTTFYPAEDYHQEYFRLNGHAPYCQFVIAPKLDKFKKIFNDKLK
jgi:peptide-methionine (S)-S-oxide reductase